MYLYNVIAYGITAESHLFFPTTHSNVSGRSRPCDRYAFFKSSGSDQNQKIWCRTPFSNWHNQRDYWLCECFGPPSCPKSPLYLGVNVYVTINSALLPLYRPPFSVTYRFIVTLNPFTRSSSVTIYDVAASPISGSSSSSKNLA